MFKCNLGDIVEDKLTGLKGTVVARTEFYNKCIRYGIQPRKIKEDGTPVEWSHIDEDQLTLVKRSADAAEPQRRTGGPHPAPKRTPNPVR